MKDKNLNILVDTCNIALILFLKSDVTKFRIPPPHCHTMSPFVDPLTLTCDVIYGWPLIAKSGDLKFLWDTCRNTETIGGLLLTCGQQIAGASSKDNTGRNMAKRQ